MSWDTYRVRRKGVDDTSWYTITEYCSDLTLKLDAEDVCDELSFSFPHDLPSDVMDELGVEVADKIRVRNTETGVDIFDGFVTKVDFTGTVTCKNAGFYLKNPIYLQATKKRTDTILKKICSKAGNGLAYGGLSYSGKISADWANQKASDCIAEVLEKLKKRNSKTYRCYVDPETGKVMVEPFQTNVHHIYVQRLDSEQVFDCTKYLSDVSGSISMENLITQVYAIKENDNGKTKAYARANWSSGISKYGTLKEYIDTDSKSEAASDARKELLAVAQLEREYKVTVYASDELVPGVRLKFDGTESVDIEDEYWITAAEHQLRQPHLATLTLKRCKDDYVKTSVKKLNSTIYTDTSKSSNSTSSSTTTTTTTYTGKTVDALYTAYYPANNSMEGGYYDAMGNKLDPSKLTCAAPKSIAFNTKIQISDTGTSKDGKVYKVTDRGGAITISNGVYHFDLLMSTAAQCNAWGKVYGKALIITGETTTTESSASSGATKLLSVAAGEIGNTTGTKYLSSGGPWCAAFVSWCARQAGISTSVIPSSAAVADFLTFAKNHGRLVTSGVPQAGDICIIKSTTESHVTIVYSASSSSFVTIGGNESGAVRKQTRSYYPSSFAGWFRPNY